MVSIKDTEHFGIGHSANHIFHGLHGEMFAHDGTIDVARIQAHSELVLLLLGNHKTVYSGSGLCTFLNDTQLLHSLKLLFKRLAKGHRNPTGRCTAGVALGSIWILCWTPLISPRPSNTSAYSDSRFSS